MPGLVEIRPQNPSTPTDNHPEPADPAPLSPLAEHLRHFHRRVLTDALLEGTAATWLRRAADFDHVGTRECDEIALACRHKAELVHDLGLDDECELLLDLVVTDARALVATRHVVQIADQFNQQLEQQAREHGGRASAWA